MADSAVARLLVTLGRYAALCTSHRAEVRAVATSAVRDAGNRDEILHRVRRETGLDLQIVSPHEEARLMCIGALHGTPHHKQSLCLDIGGGSTELVLAVGHHAIQLWSVPMGSVRLTELLDGQGDNASLALPQMKVAAQKAVRSLPEGFEDASLRDAVGCSGTIRRLVEFATGRKKASATVDELRDVSDSLAALPHDARLELFGPGRAGAIVAGAVVLHAVAERLGLQSIATTRKGLRDGLLLEMVRNRQIESVSRLSRRVA